MQQVQGQQVAPAGAEVLGECECGGQIFQGVHQLTAEAGGYVQTKSEHDAPWCTRCGEGWRLK